jgi:hypothetical protein
LKALDNALKDVETILTSDHCCCSLPICGFTPIHQEQVQHNKIVAHFKKPFWCGAHYRSVFSNCTTATLFVLVLTLLSIKVAHLLKNIKNEFPDIQVRKALMTLNLPKCFCTEHVISGQWKDGCLKYLQDQDTVKDFT